MNNSEELIKNQNSDISFGIPTAIFYSIIAVFTMQIVGGIIQAPAIYYPILNHFLMPFGFLIGILSAIGIVLAMLKTNLKSTIASFKIKPNATQLILAVFIWIGFLPLCEFFTTLIPTDGYLEDLFKQFGSAFETLLQYKVAGFIMVCIFAPIFEEILFRGIILKGLINFKINPVIAIVVSGIIFGAAHFNPWQFVGAGLLGTIFGFVYYRTKSILLPIILHALNNTLSYTIMLQNNSMDENVFNTTDYISIGIFTFFGIIMCFILYQITKNKNLKWN